MGRVQLRALSHCRECVDVNVASRMFLENFHGASFVFDIPCPHPQQQPSQIQLFLQMVCVVIAYPFSQDGAD